MRWASSIRTSIARESRWSASRRRARASPAGATPRRLRATAPCSSASRAEATRTCTPSPRAASSTSRPRRASDERAAPPRAPHAATAQHDARRAKGRPVTERIERRLAALKAQGRTALVPYVTAGDPSLATTVPLIHALVDAGADIVELGVPFSDPMADGPVIQRAAERALAQHVGLRDVIDVAREFRKRDDGTPLVLMGYLNPIEAMGTRAFVDAARAAGIDGLIVVDCPPEEMDALEPMLREAGIAPIF